MTEDKIIEIIEKNNFSADILDYPDNVDVLLSSEYRKVAKQIKDEHDKETKELTDCIKSLHACLDFAKEKIENPYKYVYPRKKIDLSVINEMLDKYRKYTEK